MNPRRFVDRQTELALLSRIHREPGARLLVLYGRRRVGKTELLKEFCRRKRSVFFVADQRPARALLDEFSALLWRAANAEAQSAPVFRGWADAFEYAGRLSRARRLVVVLDEFPYVAAVDPTLPSVLQRVWDAQLSSTRLMMVLCGSSVSYMEHEVLSQKSPLFGRRSAQMLLEPLGLPETAAFWKGNRPETVIRSYGVVGGVPAYATRFDAGRPLEENIRGEILHKNAYLFEEVPYLLVQELREPRVYFAVMQAIASGRTTQNPIAQAAGMQGNQVAPYLRTLADLRLVERVIPVQERQPHKSRKGSYRIRDPFFRFWFRFVFPNRARLDRGLADAVWKEDVAPHLDEHVSFVFEDLAAEHLWRLARIGRLPFSPTRIGPWRAADQEVDVVAVSDGGQDVLVAECKWTKRPVGGSVLLLLRKKAEQVASNLGAERSRLALFSRAGFTPDLRREARSAEILLVGPRNMVRGF